jgi:hypothetical protein
VSVKLSLHSLKLSVVQGKIAIQLFFASLSVVIISIIDKKKGCRQSGESSCIFALPKEYVGGYAEIQRTESRQAPLVLSGDK